MLHYFDKDGQLQQDRCYTVIFKFAYIKDWSSAFCLMSLRLIKTYYSNPYER
jgi:hypothetical protein